MDEENKDVSKDQANEDVKKPENQVVEVVKDLTEEEKKKIQTETSKQLLSQLGINDLTDFEKYKQAYEANLSKEEKVSIELETLRKDVEKYKVQLEDKDYIISALLAVTGTEISKVKNIVKMAKGFKEDGVTVDEAIKTVITMMQPTQDNKKLPPTEQTGDQSDKVKTEENPWDPKTLNWTKQSLIFKEDPEKARRMAKEHGIII